MKVTLTPKGYEKIGPQHKRPHFERPFQSSFYKSYRANSNCEDALRFLLEEIEARKFVPFFDREEIDGLFIEEVLKAYASGRYFDHEKLDSIRKWKDLLNNIASYTIGNRRYLIDSSGEPVPERIEAAKDLQVGWRKLKIIEDWIYYHPEEQVNIRGLLSQLAAEEQAKLQEILSKQSTPDEKPTS